MNMRFWLEALAEPKRIAAQVLTSSPMKVRTLGLIRESASQRTMVSRRTPQARPKAEVQETVIGDAPGAGRTYPQCRRERDPSLRLKCGSAQDDTSLGCVCS